MNLFLVFCVGFICGAWIGTLITALIASSHDADERERKYWENKHKE